MRIKFIGGSEIKDTKTQPGELEYVRVHVSGRLAKFIQSQISKKEAAPKKSEGKGQ